MLDATEENYFENTIKVFLKREKLIQNSKYIDPKIPI